MSLNIPDLYLQLLKGLNECLGLLEGDRGSGWEGEGTSDEGGQELQGGNALGAGLSVADHGECWGEGERERMTFSWGEKIILLLCNPALVRVRKSFSHPSLHVDSHCSFYSLIAKAL